MKLVKNFSQFIDSKKGHFFLISIFLAPQISFLRQIIKQFADYSEGAQLDGIYSNFLILICVGSCILYYNILFSQEFYKQVLFYFIRLWNQRVWQGFLLVGLLLEQILIAHPLIFITFFSSLIILYFSLPIWSFWYFLVQLLVTYLSTYLRIRNSLVNVTAFNGAGIIVDSSGGYTWNNILRGINGVISQRYGTELSVLRNRDSSCFEPSGGPDARSERAFVSNKIPGVSSQEFPFFPQINRRRYSTFGAARRVGTFVKETSEKIPFSSGLTLFGVISTISSGAFLLFDRQRVHNRAKTARN